MDINSSLVRELIAAQFPQWAHLPVQPVECGGWDNRTFHLGDEMSVRLPSAEAYAAQIEKEHRWLPSLAPLLPLAIPTPLAMGAPACGYPWRWSIYKWLEGENATIESIADPRQFAATLARFLVALQRIDPAGGPAPGLHNFYRGAPVATYDAQTRQAISALARTIDADAVTAVWEEALDAKWHGALVWLHGDVAEGNLLVTRGHLSAVIDFGCCAVGDPACDLTIAWTLFSGESREAFRTNLPLDRATWLRGRGWALWKALITLAQYRDTDAAKTRGAQRVIGAVLAERMNH